MNLHLPIRKKLPSNDDRRQTDWPRYHAHTRWFPLLRTGLRRTPRRASAQLTK